MKTKRLAVLALILLFVAGSSVLFLANPANWGTTRSARFSADEFEEIKPGDRIEAVISRLGSPVGVSTTWDYNGQSVRTFVFAGEPTRWWVFAYSKAWVLVRRDNRVLTKLWYDEP
jgi:hypothetical protein